MSPEFQPQPQPGREPQQGPAAYNPFSLNLDRPSQPDPADPQSARMKVPLEIESKDRDAAKSIVGALREAGKARETYPSRFPGSALSSIVQLGKQFYDVRKNFYNAAPEMADKVGMTDIYQDVGLHRQLQHLAAAADSAVPIFNFENGQRLPCFFSASGLQQIAKGGPKQYEEKLREALRGVAEQKQICFISRDEADSLFFGGLESYLVTRIAGDRWLAHEQARRSRVIHRAHSRERGQIGWTGLMRQGISAVKKEGQVWDVCTNRSGLVIYWADQYGVRIPFKYLGGKTEPPKPLKVFLRVGNGYIGADAGPEHTPIWEPGLVQVPDENPVFHTNFF